jgi:hypothetical protein
MYWVGLWSCRRAGDEDDASYRGSAGLSRRRGFERGEWRVRAELGLGDGCEAGQASTCSSSFSRHGRRRGALNSE